jgi:hypothetical protein
VSALQIVVCEPDGPFSGVATQRPSRLNARLGAGRLPQVEILSLAAEVIDGDALGDDGQPRQERQIGGVPLRVGELPQPVVTVRLQRGEHLHHDVPLVILAVRDPPEKPRAAQQPGKPGLERLPQTLPGPVLAGQDGRHQILVRGAHGLWTRYSCDDFFRASRHGLSGMNGAGPGNVTAPTAAR